MTKSTQEIVFSQRDAQISPENVLVSAMARAAQKK